MPSLEKPPLDAELVNEDRKLKSPWFEYFERQINDIDAISEFDITGKTDTVITAADEISFADVTDSNAIKKDTVQGILDLVSVSDVYDFGSLTAASSSTATTWTDVTSLSATVTPTSTSDKVELSGVVYISQGSGVYSTGIRLLRGATPIGVGDAASSRTQVTTGIISSSGEASLIALPIKFVDAPSTTSSTTYKLQFNNLNSGTTYFNRTITDTDSATYYRTISFLEARVLKA